MTQQQDIHHDAGDDAGEKLVLNSPEEAKSPRDFLLWAGVIVLAVMTAFSPALHGKFLWDDDKHVEQNRDLLDASGLWNIWTGHIRYFFSSDEERPRLRFFTPQYYPVTHTTYWIESQLFGSEQGPPAPVVFHVTNMILHAAGAILLWFVLRELKVPGAWVAAAIFALHPVHVESVAWITERKNVLAGAFFFGSILAYLKWQGPGSAGSGPRREATPGRNPSSLTPDPTFYFVSLVLFLLAVLSKTVACSMPAVMLLLIWWKRGRVTRRDMAATLPFFAFGLIMALFTGWIERRYVGAAGPEWKMSLIQHVLLAGNAIWFYAAKLVAPLKLTFIYPRWELSASNPLLWAGLLATIAAPVVLFLLRRRIGRGPLAAWLTYCGVLVPALGFFNVYPMKYSFVADHFQYLAAPALIALIVAGVSTLMRKTAGSAATAAYAVTGVVLILLAVLTLMQSSIYASGTDLWRDTAHKNPRAWMARYNYGQSLYAGAYEQPIDQQKQIAEMLDEAAKEFEATVAIKPDHDRAWYAWGQVLLEKHDAKQAIDKFDQALAANPKNVDALMGRGQALFQLKNYDEALPAYEKALAAATEQKGRLPNARFKAATIYQMLGKIYDARGDNNAAIAAFMEAVRIAPGVPQIHYDFGTLLAKVGKKSTTQPTTGPTTQLASTQPGASTQAVASTLQAVASTKPAATTRPFATTQPATGEQLAAATQFAAALGAAPEYVDARISLAELMLDVGNLEGARVQLATATSILSRRMVPVETTQEYPRLMEVAKRFDAAYRQAEAATRPATTQAATTQPSLPLPRYPGERVGERGERC